MNELNLSSVIDVHITVIFTDKYGNTQRLYKKAGSFVRSFIDILQAQMAQATGTGVDINGDTHNIEKSATNLQCFPNIDDGSNVGIVIGTSNAAVAVTQTALGTLCSQGTGANQVLYNNGSFEGLATSGSTRSFSIQRSMLNLSGSDISVAECGIHVRGGTTPNYFLIDRTLVSFTLSSGATASIKYTFSVIAGTTDFQVRSLIDILAAQFTQIQFASMGISYTGSTVTIVPHSANFGVNSGSGLSGQGIVVGSSSAAVVIGDYNLHTQIAHGTGTGQVQYGSCTVGAASTVSNTRQFTITRVFTGNTVDAGGVNVTEVGLYSPCYSATHTIDRTLYSFNVPKSPGTKTVTCIVKVTV